MGIISTHHDCDFGVILIVIATAPRGVKQLPQGRHGVDTWRRLHNRGWQCVDIWTRLPGG